MSRLMRLLMVLLLTIVLISDIAAAAKKRSKGGDASRYQDCDSCVAAGYGWSWEEEECGTYVNTDCSVPGHAAQQEEHSSSTYESSISTDDDKEDNDDDFSSPSSRTSRPSSSHRAAAEDEDDDELLADDDEYGSGGKTFSWSDTDATTHIWHMIHRGDYESLSRLLEQDDDVVRYRSRDGRGALWWAYEFGHDDMVDLLIAHGADQEAKDAGGKRPLEMRQMHADL